MSSTCNSIIFGLSQNIQSERTTEKTRQDKSQNVIFTAVLTADIINPDFFSFVGLKVYVLDNKHIVTYSKSLIRCSTHIDVTHINEHQLMLKYETII